MDNKLTKKRLSDFLSYDWIIMLVVIVAAIVLWELVYTIAAVRLTEGQNFKYYYDVNMYAGNDAAFYSLITEDEDDPVFSYDVLSVTSESLSSDYNVLNLRLSVYEGDVIFTDKKPEDSGNNRAKSIVDSERVYVLTDLLNDGVNYLAGFLKDGLSTQANGKEVVFDYNNLDEQKIRDNFLSRMRKDNRFRTDAQKEEGFYLEADRIKKVCEELEKFDYLLTVCEEEDMFFRYTRGQQALDEALATDSTVSAEEREQRQAVVDAEKEAGRENAPYGILLEKFTGGARQVSEFFRRSDGTDATDAVLMTFDFYDITDAGLHDLQFETVSFINRIVEEFSDIFSSRTGG